MTAMMTKTDGHAILRQMYANGYFTNHGPLAKQFEATLEGYLDVDEAVAVGNESLALLIAMAGLDLKGPIVAPALGASLIASSARWLDLSVRYCDVDPQSHQPTSDTLVAAMDSDVSAICLVELWGNRIDPQLISVAEDLQVPLIIVALDAFGSVQRQRRCHASDRSITVFGFGPGQLLTTEQGGAIATMNSEWAHRFRNVRSSYGVTQRVPVTATCNGRFSEWQAGLGLKSFNRLPETLNFRSEVAAAYDEGLAGCDWIQPFSYPHTDRPNFQHYPIMVDDPMTVAVRKMASRLGIHDAKWTDTNRCSQFPNTREIARRVFLLPFPTQNARASALELAEQLTMQA